MVAGHVDSAAMTPFPWFGALGRWMFPLLVAFLVLGHACELPALAELIVDHSERAAAVPVEHDHEDDEHALTCDGALVLPTQTVAKVTPSLVMVVVEPTLVMPGLQPASVSKALSIRSSAGPPLFLLFSSLLI